MELNQVHNEGEHASTSMKVILLVFAVVLVGVLGYLVWQQNNTQDDTDYSLPKASQKTTETTAESTTKVYTDSTNKFGFSYPKTAELATASDSKTSSSATRLSVAVYNLKTMEDQPLGYDKATLTALRNDLAAGNVKTFVTGLNAKATMTLRQLEVCDMQFTYTLDVFKEDMLVSINYSINSSQYANVVKNNPTYFAKDTTNCGTSDVWKDTGEENFRNDVAAGKTDTITQSWYKDFDALAKSFAFSN